MKNKKTNSYYMIDDYRIPRLPKLSHEELIALIKKYQEGDIESGKKIMAHNYGLVIIECSKFANEKISKIDLFQEGCIGLMKAIDNYDPSLGYKFSTYAIIWIKSKMLYYIEKNSSIRSVNQDDFQLLKKISNMENVLSIKYGRPVTKQEIAQELGVSVTKIEYLFTLLKNEISLQYGTDITGEDDYEHQDNLYEEIESDDPSLEDCVFELAKRDILLEIINDPKICKTERDKDIIMKRYGFLDGKVHTLKSLGEKHGVSFQAIEKSRILVLNRIRERYGKVLKSYYDEM